MVMHGAMLLPLHRFCHVVCYGLMSMVLHMAPAPAAAPQIRTEDIEEDAFTTEKMEEANLLMGPGVGVRSAWRTEQHLKELAYTQFW
jgi:hypothetical protein